ncbi:MAG: hypothetical protein ACON4M_08425 [Crocinitomicaceae bacterium]
MIQRFISNITKNVPLFLFIAIVGCGTKSPEIEPGSVEDAERIIAERRAKELKNAKNAKKKAIKEHLKNQSKSVQKSIKKNAKRNKKRMKYLYIK